MTLKKTMALLKQWYQRRVRGKAQCGVSKDHSKGLIHSSQRDHPPSRGRGRPGNWRDTRIPERRQWITESLVDRGKNDYDPLKAGSIDGTDTKPHDRAIVRAMNANCMFYFGFLLIIRYSQQKKCRESSGHLICLSIELQHNRRHLVQDFQFVRTYFSFTADTRYW
eukprot:TRINITY_DN3720_c0_g1_i5.p1 TRINITY_DN3720_c0_g1~~TRINITY_DN3720_c0_g1_i5.p1  ORF type:complete len:166 (-),score=20.67 TRINITY_DN3720_c0_g1_i5:488-985(-)